MTLEVVRQAAEHFAAARTGGPRTPPVPAALEPDDQAQAYAVQAELHALLSAQGLGPLVGHKIGCTTPVMQEFLKIDHPCAGEIFEKTVHHEVASLPLSDFHRVGVECEIAVQLSYDMPDMGAPYTHEAVEWSVGAVMAGIEIVEDRYENYPKFSAAALTADDFFNSGVVLSQPQAPFRFFNLAHARGTMWIDGEAAGTGAGSDIMGHPFEALAWLANHRVRLGKPLLAGEFVMLGSVVQTVFIDQPALVQIEVRGIGRAEVRFV